MKRIAIIPSLAFAACAPQAPTAEDLIPEYPGTEAVGLDGDLVQVRVAMTKALSGDDVRNYAECAASQYAVDAGYEFARHLRTNMSKEGGVWAADAVYTMSPTLPDGVAVIDARATASACQRRGIPTV